jgi:ATP-dependent helicase/nuclease subunit A
MGAREGGLLAEMVLQEPVETVGLLQKILTHLRGRRTLIVEAPEALEPLIRAFWQTADGFASWLRTAGVDQPETAEIAARFLEMAEAVEASSPAERPAALVRLLLARPHPDLCTTGGSFRAYQKKGKWCEAAKRAGLAKAHGDRLNAAQKATTLPLAEHGPRSRRRPPRASSPSSSGLRSR